MVRRPAGGPSSAVERGGVLVMVMRPASFRRRLSTSERARNCRGVPTPTRVPCLHGYGSRSLVSAFEGGCAPGTVDRDLGRRDRGRRPARGAGLGPVARAHGPCRPGQLRRRDLGPAPGRRLGRRGRVRDRPHPAATPGRLALPGPERHDPGLRPARGLDRVGSTGAAGVAARNGRCRGGQRRHLDPVVRPRGVDPAPHTHRHLSLPTLAGARPGHRRCRRGGVPAEPA